MRLKMTDLALIAVSAALISVFSQIIIPLPSGIPLTLQTFMIALVGYILGSFEGIAAVFIYIFLGAVGVPVFTGFQGGLGALFGFTGGFILGFLPLVFMCGIETKRLFLKIVFGIVGLIFCHLLGVLYFSHYSGDLRSAFFAASVPYIAKDIISVALASIISGKIKRAILVYIM